jgi:hypothetical protein
MAYYDYFGDLMKGYNFGSQVKDKMEQNKIKDVEAQYAKQYGTGGPVGATPAATTPEQAKPTDVSGKDFPTTPVPDDKTTIERTSPFGTYDEKGMESPADSLFGFKGQAPTASEKKSMATGTPMDAEAPKPLTDVVKQAESPRPGTAPTSPQETKPVMTQHMEAHTVANDLNQAINYKRGLADEYRRKGMPEQANKVQSEMFDLQGKAVEANIKSLELQDKVLDGVGGIVDGYIKRAETSPDEEQKARAIAQMQLHNIGYDGQIKFSDNPLDNIAQAKQVYASTTSGKERTKLMIEKTKADEKERMDNKKVELQVRSANLGDRRQSFREKSGDIKANTALLKEEIDISKEFLNLSENGTTKEMRQSAYASFLEMQQKIKEDTAALAKQTKGKVEVPAAPKAAPAKPQQAKVEALPVDQERALALKHIKDRPELKAKIEDIFKANHPGEDLYAKAN